MIAVEVEADEPGWEAAGDLALLSRRAAEAVAATLGGPMGEASATILFTGDEAIRALNGRWRGQDKPTNVLSFPSPPLPGGTRHLGEVALGFGAVAREAAAEAKSVADHATHLVVHGLLHLLGQDHEDDEAAEAMEAIEIRALARLGIPDPYGRAA